MIHYASSGTCGKTSMKKGLLLVAAISIALILLGLRMFHWQGVDYCGGAIRGIHFLQCEATYKH
jgi:hypothetical protein